MVLREALEAYWDRDDVISEDDHRVLPFIVGIEHGIGELVVGDLTEMPHLLIAGTTGSGKSVMIHTIICSLLSWATPADVGFVLMDFKRVEFVPYKNLELLALPVITEPEDARMALDWLVAEMERRFRLMEEAGVVDIGALRDHYDIDFPERIVLIIDELADLILQDRTVEIPIVRLAQKGRASGIHLVLSTQRPTTNVVTGLIKANVPSRMAFSVASMIDSRVILDQPGAEQLLGRGDVLFRAVGEDIVRAQGAFIDRESIERVVEKHRVAE